MTSPTLSSWIHILNDHYTALYPSALATVTSETSRYHVKNSGDVKVAVHKGALHDYPVGEGIELNFGPGVKRWQRLVDATLAKTGGVRPFGARQYQGITSDIKGSRSVILIHNGPEAVSVLKKANPEALVCHWAHNEFWRTYGRRELKALVATADRMICVSDYIANELRAKLGSDSDKIRVVNNGIDIERFKPAALPVEEPVVSFIGRVYHLKGPHLLLKAAQLLDNGERKFKVRIVGGVKADSPEALPPYEKELRELAQPLSDKVTVEFVSAVNRLQIIEEYQKASIFCVPSVWNDPCPLTVLEGMACGIATVTTKRGGIPEMGADAVQYFDPDDPNTLAQILAPMIENASERARWGEKARARAEAMSWEKQYEVLLKAIQ
ncbi:glycosyltransferase family 1 protein [bacterium]|nr:MAG: glycosyltransferase family 1 protein [bacterium]